MSLILMKILSLILQTNLCFLVYSHSSFCFLCNISFSLVVEGAEFFSFGIKHKLKIRVHLAFAFAGFAAAAGSSPAALSSTLAVFTAFSTSFTRHYIKGLYLNFNLVVLLFQEFPIRSRHSTFLLKFVLNLFLIYLN